MATTTKTTAAPADEPKTTLGVEDYKTEQEKGGKDPVGEVKEPTEKVEKMDLAPKEPYPTGAPQDPEDAFFAIHGYRRAK